MTEHHCLVLDLVTRKSDRLEDAARIARANADALKLIAEEAWFAFDEAEDAAIDAKIAVSDWDEVVDGDVSLEEYVEMKKAAGNDNPFSFD